MRLHHLALPAAVAALAVAACGSDTSTSSGGSVSTQTQAGVSNICKTTTANPGYTNGVATLTGGANSLSGAGSTFINPLMSVWASTYATQVGTQVAYQSIGSGGGIAQLDAGTVDFGASDAFMTDADIAKAKGPVVQIPLTLAPVVVAYNLPGVTGLQFDGDTVGQIFSGKITSWDDPAIKALNPKATIPPGTAIAVNHRSDASGTTFIFTDYLTKESPTWVTALGGASKSVGKTVAWPVGIGGKGNEGVSAGIQTTGAIGYVELGYAIQQHLTYANIKNKAGNFIEPCIATVSAATNGVSYPDDLRFDLTDQSGTNAYPITGTPWALVYQDQKDPAKAAALVNFLSWTLTKGQDLSQSVNYAPLGKDLQGKCITQLKKLTLNGQPLVK